MPSKLFDLSGRVAAVTGAARGLGRTLAHGLAAHGAQVIVGDRDEDGVRATAAAINADGGQVSAASLDVTDREDCEAFVRHAASRLSTFPQLHPWSLSRSSGRTVGPVVFLASDASSYVTGAILFVDGGYTAA